MYYVHLFIFLYANIEAVIMQGIVPRPTVAQACDCMQDGCGFVSQSGESFGNEENHGIEFHHTQYLLNSAKSAEIKCLKGTEYLNTRFPGSRCLRCNVRRIQRESNKKNQLLAVSH